MPRAEDDISTFHRGLGLLGLIAPAAVCCVASYHPWPSVGRTQLVLYTALASSGFRACCTSAAFSFAGVFSEFPYPLRGASLLSFKEGKTNLDLQRETTKHQRERVSRQLDRCSSRRLRAPGKPKWVRMAVVP